MTSSGMPIVGREEDARSKKAKDVQKTMEFRSRGSGKFEPAFSPSTLQKASYPSWVSVSHLPANDILVMLRVEEWDQRCWGKLRKEQGTETKNITRLYTLDLSPPPSFACDDTKEQLQLNMMSSTGYEGEANKKHKQVFMEFTGRE